jgi:hypothetical protein
MMKYELICPAAGVVLHAVMESVAAIDVWPPVFCGSRADKPEIVSYFTYVSEVCAAMLRLKLSEI